MLIHIVASKKMMITKARLSLWIGHDSSTFGQLHVMSFYSPFRPTSAVGGSLYLNIFCITITGGYLNLFIMRLYVEKKLRNIYKNI